MDDRKRPWAADTEALEATEHHWADFAGWLQWMRRQHGDDGDAVIGELGAGEQATLYLICCRLADGTESVDIDDANVRDMGRDGEASE